MAKRPSVNEIIAAVRSGGQPGPPPESPPDEPAAERREASTPDPSKVEPTRPGSGVTPPGPVAGRPMSVKEKLAAIRSQPSGTSSSPAPSLDHPAGASEDASEPSPTEAPAVAGSPKSVKEKLAAARNRPVGKASSESGPDLRQGRNAAPSTETTPGAPPSPTARPLSMKQKLAAARAQTTKASAPATSASGEASGPAGPPEERAEAALPTLPGRTKPSLELADRLKASIRNPSVAVERPEAARSGAPRRGDRGRRGFSGFLSTIGVWGALAAVGGTLVVTTVVLLAGSGRGEALTGTLIVGPPDEIEADHVSDEFIGLGGFWLVRSSAFDGTDSIVALHAACPVRGCVVRWDDDRRWFECPCDESTFTIAGLVSGGPSPRALERCRITRGEDGLIRVDPTRTYREERGQWADPESFVSP